MDGILDLFAQHSRRLVTLAYIALVVLISLSVANTVVFFVRNLSDDVTGHAFASSVASGSRKSDQVNLSELNLFGKPQTAAPAAKDAPETNLNLELQGVFTAADAKASTAIIAEHNKTGKLYQIGDHLPGNAVLKAVFVDHILIERGARLEKLMFSNAKLVSQPFGGSQAASAAVSRPPAPVYEARGAAPHRLQAPRESVSTPQPGIAQTSKPNTSAGASIRDYVAHFHQEIQSDPRAVLHKLDVQPVAVGQPNGYRIGSNIPQQMLSQAGLQQGDVIMSVNGTPVGDVASDSSLVNQVMAAGRARVEVQRGQRKFFLTVPIPKSR